MRKECEREKSMLLEKEIMLRQDTDSDVVPPSLLRKIDIANKFIEGSKAPATKVAYASDWRIFKRWCFENNLTSLPADTNTVALFLSDQANQGFKVATIGRRLAAIRFTHKTKGKPLSSEDNLISRVVSGIKRKLGVAPNRKRPLVADLFSQLLSHVPEDTVKGIRDRALLLIGFGGAFRSSELVALCVGDVKVVKEGLRIVIRKSKTDQEGKGQEIVIPREVTAPVVCPVVALEKWLDVSKIVSGPLFYALNRWGHILNKPIASQSIRLIVKHYANIAGIDSKNLSAHSLRSGWITSAAENKASVFKLREVSRHKTLSILSDYVMSANKFENHAGAGLLPTKIKQTKVCKYCGM